MDKREIVKKHIKSYSDFPKPGIIFRDIFSVLHNPEIFSVLNEIIIEIAKGITPKIDVVVGIDSRGFLFGPILSLELKLPFVPIRKKGKLPGDVKAITYQLEYGQDTLEIQNDTILPGQNVLLVDDLLATGGTMGAACQLVEQVGGIPSACLIIVELKDLKGREKIKCPIHSVTEF